MQEFTMDDCCILPTTLYNYFIDVFVKTYIITAIHSEHKGIRKKLKAKVSGAKEFCINKHNECHQNELYLGTLPFHD
jgi:hypothetical protein